MSETALANRHSDIWALLAAKIRALVDGSASAHPNRTRPASHRVQGNVRLPVRRRNLIEMQYYFIDFRYGGG